MAKTSSLYDLETLFLEKLQEKYKLNIRDVKRAFSRFDLDNNGLLDLNEMAKGIQMFLNGVQEAQVRDLVAQYDVNGDGKISYEEFLGFLSTRSAIDPNEDINGGGSRLGSPDPADRYMQRKGIIPPPPPQQQQQQRRPSSSRGGYSESVYSDAQRSTGSGYFYADEGEDDYRPLSAMAGRSGRWQQGRGSDLPIPPEQTRRPGSAASTAVSSEARDASDPHVLEYRTKVYLQHLRAYLVKKAADMRLKGQVKQPHTMTLDTLHENVARSILAKAFQPFTGEGEGRARTRLQGVELPDFARVLRSFQFPGTAPLKAETAQYLFDLCSHTEDQGVLRNEEGRPVADANFLLGLLFGHQTTRSEEVQRKGGRAVDASFDETKKAGSLDATAEESFTGLPLKSYAAKMDAGRQAVGIIPDRYPTTTAGADAHSANLAVPLRFLSRKSRTALAVPANFDAAGALMRSNQLPGYTLRRRHVFGLSTTHYSGNTLYALPPNAVPEAFSDLRSQKSSGRPLSAPGTSRNNPDFLDPATILYTSAALSVVHNLSNNTQLFFNEHADDVTCVALNPEGTLAATGCMGKQAVVLVWRTNLVDQPDSGDLRTAGQHPSLVAEIGRGFFERGVNAIEFSYDSRYIMAVGCDDNAMLGIFDLRSGAKIVEMSAQHGIPPQLAWVKYCPAPQFTEYITRDHAGPCDVFVTAGEHHLRLWSFVRPTGSSAAQLDYKGLSATTISAKKGSSAASSKAGLLGSPKSYTCCDFLACEDKTFDLITGGSNGGVYLWRRGNLLATQQLWRGKVQCLVVHGDKVYVGGAGGLLKVLDGRTLTSLKTCALLGLQALPKAPKRPGSAADVAREFAKPRSASAARPHISSAHAGGARTAVSRPGSSGIAAGRPSAAINRPASVIARDDAGLDQDAAGNDEEGASADPGARLVTGIAVLTPSAALNARGSANHIYVIASLGTGKIVRVDVNATAPAGPQIHQPQLHHNSATAGLDRFVARDLMHFHVGPVWGLATDVSQARRLTVTAGDDKKLMVWDTEDRTLVAKTSLKSPVRCIDIDQTSCFVAAGSTSGDVTVYFLGDTLKRGLYTVEEVAYRKDAKAEVTCIGFAPSNNHLAMGCRDDSIYVYSAAMSVQVSQGVTQGQRKQESVGSCLLRALHRLRGHSSTITHLDWSYDSRLLRTTCAAYELLCWDVAAGKLYTATSVADIKWKTHHCVLGFHVMGIWPPYSDGTDINSVRESLLCLYSGQTLHSFEYSFILVFSFLRWMFVSRKGSLPRPMMPVVSCVC